jgi:hypothetical protein
MRLHKNCEKILRKEISTRDKNVCTETISTHCALFERVVRTFVATKAPLACSSNGCCAYTTCVVHTVHCGRPGHEKLNGVTLRILSWLAVQR